MIRVETRDDIAAGVVLVTLDRPDVRNAVDRATLEQLLDWQGSLDDSVRAVVITGRPPAFSAGADLTGVDESEFAGLLRRVLQGFTELPAVVIAAIDGPALGAGIQLAMVADLRVATGSSVLGVPAARLGLVVDLWTVERLTREFSWPVARAMLLSAEAYTAERLAVLGAVHRLGDLSTALDWAGEIARLAPLTIRGHKVALEHVAQRSVDAPVAALVEEARARAWASEDAVEGREAFRQKRPPVFRGR